MKCTTCGSGALVAGRLSDGGGDSTSFTPDTTPRLKRAFGVGARKVLAYACLHCHGLQFAVEFTSADLEKYQSFEGQQPDVLDRISDRDP